MTTTGEEVRSVRIPEVGTLPNFFVAGAGRSGTTALTDFVRQHPDGFVTDPKEPHFLAFAGAPPAFTGPGDGDNINRRSVTELGRYLGLYEEAAGALARGDGSVTTMYYHDRAIPRIQRWFPDARIVMILRDPAARAFSSYQYMRARGYEPETDFGRALDLEESRIAAGWQHLWHYTRMGLYARPVEAYLSAFGSERVKVFFYEELVEEPDRLARDLFAFLGLDRDVDVKTDRRVNASGEIRNPKMQELMKFAAARPAVRKVVRRAVPFHVREQIRSKNLSRRTMTERIRQQLASRFSGDLARLRAVLDREGPDWLGG